MYGLRSNVFDRFRTPCLSSSRVLGGLTLLALSGSAWAQPEAGPPVMPATPAPSPGALQPEGRELVIRAGRQNTEQQRRESTAAKIVIGREEIDRQGDATLGEVLRRLPGVTVQGAPGRGGGIRMRGLGSGYTQILLDGERVPPGFSIESITPEQVERIEILRAPTAETGARAIGGTINIVLREGQRANPDDLKLTRSVEHGEGSTQLQWIHNVSGGPLTGNFTLTLHDQNRPDASRVFTQAQSGGLDDESRVRDARWLGQRQALHASARLQWRGEQGRSLTLTPFVVYADNGSLGRVLLQRTALQGSAAPLFEQAGAQVLTDSLFRMARLNGHWAQRASADDRLELRLGLGQSRYDYRLDQIADAGASRLLPDQFETQDFTDDSLSLNGKWTRALDNGQQWVSGLEFEGVNRREAANLAVIEDAGDLQARTRRWAAYTQHEWKIDSNWSAHAGLRHERITTEGSSDAGERRNESAVWTPLAHALWKPRPGSRDQVRISLTRSYRTPTLYNLVARPVPSRETNSPTRADRVGNPDLRPELAAGLDIAAERYLAGGGVLSANVFHRRIDGLIRYVTLQQFSPPWAPGELRWVSTPRNVGDAITQGLELEAKFRLDQVWTSAAPVDIRSNLSLFRSRVKDVPGPDNRLDQQPGMTANLGGDYRLRSLPLTLGGNLNFNPDYDTRRTLEQWSYQGTRRVLDAYGLWRFSPSAALRLTVSNLVPRTHVSGTRFEGAGFAERTRTESASWRTVQLRLEMKI
jgi:outer membrane receptor for ferrienterochelin and colicins